MDKYQERILKAIDQSNLFIGCGHIASIEEVTTLTYSVNTQRDLIAILKSGHYEKIALFDKAKDLLGEELIVVRLRNEKGNIFYGLVYDSVALWQDPQVLEIIPETS